MLSLKDQTLYFQWWEGRDLNPRQIGYEPTALTPELPSRF